MNNKRLIFTSLISIILVCILLIGSTYSIFTTGGIEENANVYTTGNLDITYTLSDTNIKLENPIPTSKEDAIYIKPYRIKISNKGNVAYKFNIILNNTTATSSINPDYIMTQVGTIDAEALSSYNDNIIKSGVVVDAGQSIDVDVRVYLAENIPNTEIGKNFTATLSIDGIAISNLEKVDNSILTAKYLEKHSIIDVKNAISDKNIDYKKIVTDNVSGLYYTEDIKNYGENNHKIYYYMGDYAKVNNWIIFGKNALGVPMCFRIIRTTSTGGTKLIYSGIAKNGSCEANTQNSSALVIDNTKFSTASDNPKYVLWQGQFANNQSGTVISNTDFSSESLQYNLKQYGNNKAYDSLIKTAIRSWYYNNIVNTGYKNYLENMNLCLDLSDKNISLDKENIQASNDGQDYYFNSHINIGEHPSYYCSNNKVITGKYGLITEDEASYGGVLRDSNVLSVNNWLVVHNNSYWTLSPSYFSNDGVSYITSIDKSGYLHDVSSDSVIGIRPVISLKAKINKTGGNGTIANPYTIE